MSARAPAALAGPLCVIAAVVVAFSFLVEPFRQFETDAAGWLLHALGVGPETVQPQPGGSFAVYPPAEMPFLAVVTPACSSLASLLAIAALSAFSPKRPGGRRLLALGCALLCVAVGNIVRIAASIAVGLVAGTGSLVLFHDWVGSLFAFAYTLGGYLLMLAVLLPAQRRPDPTEVRIHAA